MAAPDSGMVLEVWLTAVVSSLKERVETPDVSLFSRVEVQTNDSDRYALLALYAATATTLGPVRYLEIGSYQPGWLQVSNASPRPALLAVSAIRPIGRAVARV
jgi:hypothetical protein